MATWGDWQQIDDPDHGTYYYNFVTAESLWEPPEGWAPEKAAEYVASLAVARRFQRPLRAPRPHVPR